MPTKWIYKEGENIDEGRVGDSRGEKDERPAHDASRTGALG